MGRRLTPPRKETALEIQVRQQIEALQQMTVGQLRGKYREVFGEESRSIISSSCFGASPDASRPTLRAVFPSVPMNARLRLPTTLTSGSRLRRDSTLAIRRGGASHGSWRPPIRGFCRLDRTSFAKWRGRRSWWVRTNGFEYNGRIYRSLSAIARDVTATKWNGYMFFNLGNGGGKDAER
jgi:hypothetical protein